jgi:putative DNA primase/helicase
LVKTLTGKEQIKARRMREDFWAFRPTHKICLVTNHKPRVRGTDHAVWRRLRLIPFVTRFWDPDADETGPPELKQVKQLAEKLDRERPGILAWMVRGASTRLQEGLKCPTEVKEATAQYRTSEDVFADFLENACVLDPDGCERFSNLLDAFRKWSGNRRMSSKLFSELLGDHGIGKEKVGGVTYSLGVTLQGDWRPRDGGFEQDDPAN